MKGTRLWQNTGSPLISGRSRRERPFSQQLGLAWGLAVGIVAGFVAVFSASLHLPSWGALELGVSQPVAVVLGSVAYAAIPAAIGATFGVWLARRMGWNRPWIAGGAAGVLIAFGALALSALWL